MTDIDASAPAGLSREHYVERAEYDRACEQIADMHAAAHGGEVRGPARGVVEDIADLWARCQAAEEALHNSFEDVRRVTQQRDALLDLTQDAINRLGIAVGDVGDWRARLAAARSSA